MMRYMFIPKKDQIPQWKQCYYDYSTLKQIQIFIYLIQQKYSCVNNTIKNQGISLLDRAQNGQSDVKILQNNKFYNEKYQQLQHYKQYLVQLLQKWCYQFTKYSYQSSSIVDTFAKMKMEQIKSKHEEYNKFLTLLHTQKTKILLVLENLYIEAFYLWKSIYYNVAQQSDVTKQFQIFSEKYPQFYRKFSENNKLKRFKIMSYEIFHSIQATYLRASPYRQKRAFQVLQQLALKDSTNMSHQQLRLLGLVMGMLAVMVAIVIQTDVFYGIQLESNKKFTQHFPIWRGASYILFYIWMLGLDVLFYEKSRINYKLVFQFKNHSMPHSKRLFLRAGILSLVYIFLFYIFTLIISGIINSTFLHLGAIFWAILIFQLFLFAPSNIFNEHKGRFYFYKLLGRVIASPFIRINFIIIWFTEQLSSFNRPFGDFYYTICYISSSKSKFCLDSSPYASSAYIILIFIYRIIQNSKLWHQNTMLKPDKKYVFTDPPFLGILRGLFSFLTALLALFDKLQLFKGAFYLWLFSSIITTLYSWFYDIRYDWGILNLDSKTCLRHKLLFPHAKYLYYFFTIFNLVLRTAWVMTISSIALFNDGFGYLLYIMIISYLQIFRRGVWNILRVQNQHIKNCGQFKATITDDKILDQVRTLAKIKKQKLRKLAQECQKIYIPGDTRRKILRLRCDTFTRYLRRLENKQLDNLRTTQNKQLLRQSLTYISEQQERLRQLLKEDKRKIAANQLKIYKQKFLKMINIKSKII